MRMESSTEKMTVNVPMIYTVFDTLRFEVPATLRSMDDIMDYIEEHFDEIPIPTDGTLLEKSVEFDAEAFPWHNEELEARLEGDGQDGPELSSEARDMQAARGALDQRPEQQSEKGVHHGR